MRIASDAAERARWRWITVLSVLVIVLASARSLVWLEFSSGSENLVVATALETRRTGQWLLPRLNDDLRVNKPPLPTWIATALVPHATVTQLSSTSGGVRDNAYRALAWQVRLPALLLAGLTLLVIYEIGQTLESGSFGWTAALVAGSSLLWLRFGRSHTTDVHLMLWVTIANWMLIRALLARGSNWTNLPLAGFAIGCALMSKGPVAWVQTLLPVLIGCTFIRFHESTGHGSRRQLLLPSLLGLLVMLAVALPWPIAVYLREPLVLDQWKREIFRAGATTLAPDPWYAYVSLFPMLLPWVGLFILGLILSAVRGAKPGLRLAVLMLVVPVIVMSLAKDKNERYLLPLLAPAALIVAYAVESVFKPAFQRNRIDRMFAAIHIITLLMLCVGLPLLGARAWLPQFRTVGGLPWFTQRQAATFIVACIVPLLLALHASRWNVVIATTLSMLMVQMVFLYGYAQSPDGRSELKPIAETVWKESPHAAVVFYNQRDEAKAVPMDLVIYLNRVVRVVTQVPGNQDPVDAVAAFWKTEDDPLELPAPWLTATELEWGKRTWRLWIKADAP